MRTSDFTGTGTLFRLFLRRDRFLLFIWILLPSILLLGNAATFIAMGNQGQGLQNALTQFNNDPLISAVLGPVMSIDLSGAIVWRTVSLLSLALGISSLLTVIRHTRTDEETGRSELIRAYIVGYFANLTAALILTVVGNLAAGVLIALSIISLGGAAGGSFLFGATMSTIGCFFAGIGALAVQLRDNSGSARGIGIAALGLGYVFISIGIYLMSLIVAVYAMSTVLRLKKEENDGRTEMLLDKHVSRIRWMSSHLIAAALGSAALLLSMGIAGGLVYGIAAGDLSTEFWRIFAMSVTKIPPVWLLFSFTALLYGLWPGITALGWIVWLSFTLLEVTWEAQLIDWSVMSISPFSYVHYTINITNLPLLPLFWLLCVSAILTGIGLFGFRKRDVLTKA